MTPNAKYFTFIFDFFEFRPFALIFDNSFGKKDNKNPDFSLTNDFHSVIVTKNKRGKGYENISFQKTRYAEFLACKV